MFRLYCNCVNWLLLLLLLPVSVCLSSTDELVVFDEKKCVLEASLYAKGNTNGKLAEVNVELNDVLLDWAVVVFIGKGAGDNMDVANTLLLFLFFVRLAPCVWLFSPKLTLLI